jgi:hypothetical protein
VYPGDIFWPGIGHCFPISALSVWDQIVQGQIGMKFLTFPRTLDPGLLFGIQEGIPSRDYKGTSCSLEFQQPLILLWHWTSHFPSQSYIFNHHRLFLQVDLKCPPSGTSGFSFTVSVFLTLSQYANTHTQRHHAHKHIYTQIQTHSGYIRFMLNIIGSELITFYLLNINFQQYEKLLCAKNESWNELII